MQIMATRRRVTDRRASDQRRPRKIDEPSLTQLIRGHDAGTLEQIWSPLRTISAGHIRLNDHM